MRSVCTLFVHLVFLSICFRCVRQIGSSVRPVETIQSYRAAQLLIFTCRFVVVIRQAAIGAWGSDCLVTARWVWLNREACVCMRARVRASPVLCPPTPRLSEKVWVLLIKQRRANLSPTAPESACFIKTWKLFKTPPPKQASSLASSVSRSPFCPPVPIFRLFWFLLHSFRHFLANTGWTKLLNYIWESIKIWHTFMYLSQI